MTREQIYASLMRLYPKPFRREYEAQMLETFRELSRDTPHAAHFWTVVLRDVCRSVAREHVVEWTSGMQQLARNWIVACSFGAMGSGVVIWGFILSVDLLFPPRTDPRGVVDIVATNLPPAVYGAIIGLVIGGTQAAALRQHLRRGLLWTAVTSLAVAGAFPLGLAVANWIGFRVVPVGYFVGIGLLGILVGVSQSLILKSGARTAVQWTLWSAVAVPAGMLTGIACDFLFTANPRTWYGLALAFAIYPAVIGLVIGALTVRPLTTVLSQRSVTHQ
jgi:hypothetical protein